MNSLDILDLIQNEVTVSFTLSSGPGGQNVNKNSTKAVLRWDVFSSKLPEIYRRRLISKWESQLSKKGEMIISSQTFRSQERNEKSCRDKLSAMVLRGIAVPKRRVKTRPRKSTLRKRAETNKRHSAKKESRKKVSE